MSNQFQAKLFQPSVWDDIPMKRDNKYMSVIVDPDFELDNLENPVKLPPKFEFITLSQHDPKHISLITAFLNNHYLSSKISEDVYRYSSRFIEYKLHSPSAHFKQRDSIVLAISKKSKENESLSLYGIVVALPVLYCIDGNYVSSFCVEWLATHTKFRGKKMAIVLQKELYRRMCATGCSVGALFCAPMTLPFQPITNPSKLMCKFLSEKCDERVSHQIEKLSLAKNKVKDAEKLKEINRLIEELTPKGLSATEEFSRIRLANKNDMVNLYEIYYQRCQSKFRLYRVYNQKEFIHAFMPRKDMIYTYVMMNGDGAVIDFITIYNLSGSDSKSAYLFYATFPGDVSEILRRFLQNVVYILSKSGYRALYSHQYLGLGDVLDVLDFKFVSEHDKGVGCYAFNYNTKTINNSECGLGVYV